MICCLFSGGIIISSGSFVFHFLYFLIYLMKKFYQLFISNQISSCFCKFFNFFSTTCFSKTSSWFFLQYRLNSYHIYLQIFLQHLFLLLLQYSLIFYHIYLQIFLQITKSHILLHILYNLVQVNISFLY